MNSRFRLRTLLLGIVVVAITMAASRAGWLYATGPIFSESQLKKLYGGMPEEEVIAVLGEPDDYEPSKPSWGAGFTYRHRYGYGDVYVHCEWHEDQDENGDWSNIIALTTIDDQHPRYSKQYGRRRWDFDDGKWVRRKE